MKTIWKYPLDVADHQVLNIPAGAEILCVQVQNGQACLWALVNADAPPARRGIFIHGTGHEVNRLAGKYIGTFQLMGGALVFHVFEEK